MIIIDFKILDKKWKIRILKKKKYRRKHGDDSVAINMGWKRCIDVPPSGIDIETIIHEVGHAYMHEMCLKSTNEITAADVEEIFMELLSKRGREILDLSDNLLGEINKALSAHITSVQDTKSKKRKLTKVYT